MKSKSVYPLIFVLALVSNSYASSIIEDLAAQHNAIILGNLTVDSADTEGRMLVTGNFESSNTLYTIGTSGAGHPQNPPQQGRDDLIVGGQYHYTGASGAWVGLQITEDAVVGGTADPNHVHFDAAGATSSGQGTLTANAGALKVDRTTGNVTTLSSGVALSDLHNQFIQESMSLSQFSDSSHISIIQDDPWALGISTTDIGYDDTYIINVTQAQWENESYKSRTISARAGDTVIINVAGTNINLTGGTIVLEGITEDRVLINYYEATSLDLGVTHKGSVLAPKTTTVSMSKSIDGVAMFAGDVTKTNNAEFHNFLFAGDISHLVPEPSSISLLAIGLTFVTMRRHRRTA